MLRDDVQNGRAHHAFGMIEAHPVKHARTAVMAGCIKALVAKRRHDLDLILRHGAKGVAAVIVTARWLFGIAVAAQISGHHRELSRQSRRDLVPGQVGEWIAVHEQERRSSPAMHGQDACAACRYLRPAEAFEHAAGISG